MPTPEHQFLADLFKDRPERVSALVADLAGILELLPPAYKGADLWESKTTLHPTELISERVVRLADRTGAYVRAIVIEVQQSIADEKRRSWPIYGWAAWRETGLESDVVVIAAMDNVARWAQGTITNGRHTFNVHVIGRHNVPAITDERLARAKPLLTLLSAGLHLQSTSPHVEASITQAEMDQQCAAQMKLADIVAHDIGLPEAAGYVRMLFDHLSDEAKRMATDDCGPIWTTFDERIKAANERAKVAEMDAVAAKADAAAKETAAREGAMEVALSLCVARFGWQPSRPVRPSP